MSEITKASAGKFRNTPDLILSISYQLYAFLVLCIIQIVDFCFHEAKILTTMVLYFDYVCSDRLSHSSFGELVPEPSF